MQIIVPNLSWHRTIAISISSQFSVVPNLQNRTQAQEMSAAISLLHYSRMYVRIKQQQIILQTSVATIQTTPELDLIDANIIKQHANPARRRNQEPFRLT